MKSGPNVLAHGSAGLAAMSLLLTGTSWSSPASIRDDFDDNSLDLAVWQINTDADNASVLEQNQRIELNRRGYLFTQAQFDPLTRGAVQVAATITFNDPVDAIDLITRYDGTTLGSGASWNPSTGLVCSVNNASNELRIVELPAGTILQSVSLDVEAGDSFRIVAIDTGSDVWFSAGEIGGDGSAAEVSAPSSTQWPTDFVGFFNRESRGPAYLDDVSITVLETDSFGAAGDSFILDFVTVGEAGNPSDSGTTGSYFTPHGGVSTDFRISRTAISEKMIVVANTLGGLGITQLSRGDDKPAGSVTWNEAARFVNWLNTSKGFPPAYKFPSQPGEGGYDPLADIQLWDSGDAGYDLANPYRNTGAAYFLPSEDEFYKAAFYSGSGSRYFDYATGTDSIPSAVASGTILGTVVYANSIGAGPADVDLAGGLSPSGTIGQTGNTWEAIESAADGSNNDPAENRTMRGGNWTDSEWYLRSERRLTLVPTHQDQAISFRVASRVLTPPEIAVEEPVGNALADGTSVIDLGTEAEGCATAPRVFRIRNLGDGDLAGVAVTVDGPDASDFLLLSTPSAIVSHASHSDFAVEFVPTGATATKSAFLRIANNDADENPFDIELAGQGLSQAEDDDADGLNDAAEFKLASLGFDWQTNQAVLVADLLDNAHVAGLFTEEEITNVHAPAPLIEVIDGTLTLELQLMKSDDLDTWDPFGGPVQWSEPAVGKRFFRLFFDDTP